MAETLVDKSLCEACGTSVREGATFCFNCGESIIATEDAPPPPAILRPDADLLNGRPSGGPRSIGLKEREPAPISIPQSRLEAPEPLVRGTENRPITGPGFVSDRRPTSDPAPDKPVRKTQRTRTRKIAEVEWVERTSASPLFIVAAVLFAAVVGLMIAAALYLK